MCVSPVCLMCVVPLDGNTSLLWVSFDGYVSMYMICSRMCVSQRALSKKYLSFVGLLAQRPLRDTHAEQRRCSDVLPGCRVWESPHVGTFSPPTHQHIVFHHPKSPIFVQYIPTPCHPAMLPSNYHKNYRFLLQKSPIKETIFCKRHL